MRASRFQLDCSIGMTSSEAKGEAAVNDGEATRREDGLGSDRYLVWLRRRNGTVRCGRALPVRPSVRGAALAECLGGEREARSGTSPAIGWWGLSIRIESGHRIVARSRP